MEQVKRKERQQPIYQTFHNNMSRNEEEELKSLA